MGMGSVIVENGKKVLTMAEYIERKRAIVDACNSLELYPSEYAKLEDALNKIPAADVADVVHGEWLRSDDDWNSLTTIQCSLCSEEWCFETDDDVSLLNYKYCPNCGAKMDGGFDDGKRCD